MPTQETSEAEIAELDDAIFGEEDVFRFDVAMDAVVRVTVAHCLYQLPRDPFRQYLRHSAIAISIVSTILALSVIHHLSSAFISGVHSTRNLL